MAARREISDEYPLIEPLDAAGARPALSGPRDQKKNYAERLSRALAVLMALGLHKYFPKRIKPTPDDLGHETPFAGETGKKRLDVVVWDEHDGLLLDVSIKTLSFRDWDEKKKRAGRFTKNVVRNDHELRAEADTIHRRQPFAVLVAIMFMPFEACTDGSSKDPSSFAHAVRTFRQRSGRQGPDDPRYERFEAFYIGLYEYEGPERGRARFFRVQDPPPKNGRPKREHTLSFSEFIAEIKRLYDARNGEAEIEWAEPESEPPPGNALPDVDEDTE